MKMKFEQAIEKARKFAPKTEGVYVSREVIRVTDRENSLEFPGPWPVKCEPKVYLIPSGVTVLGVGESGELITNVGKMKVTALDADEFPVFNPKFSGESLTLTKPQAEAIQICGKYIHKDPMKAPMDAVCLNSKEDAFICGTDAYRLAIFDNSIGLDVPVFFPARVLPFVEPGAKVKPTESGFAMEGDGVIVFWKYERRAFLNVRAVLPAKPGESILTVPQASFKKDLKTALTCANKTSSQIVITTQAGGAWILGKDVDMDSEARFWFPCLSQGPDIQIGFNGKYLADFPGNEIAIHMEAPNRAAIIRVTDGTETEKAGTYLCMPVIIEGLEFGAAPDGGPVAMERTKTAPEKKAKVSPAPAKASGAIVYGSLAKVEKQETIPAKEETKQSPPNGIRIVKYTDKSFAVIGDTRHLKEEMKKNWGSFCSGLKVDGESVKGWVFSNKRLEDIKKLIAQ